MVWCVVSCWHWHGRELEKEGKVRGGCTHTVRHIFEMNCVGLNEIRETKNESSLYYEYVLSFSLSLSLYTLS